MKRYVCMFMVGAEELEEAITLGREIVGGRGPDLTVMEADERDDLSTMVDALGMSELPESRAMKWSSEVTCAGWMCRIEFDSRAELGAVSFIAIPGMRTEASMVLTAPHMRDLLMGVAAFPYGLIKEMADRSEGNATGG